MTFACLCKATALHSGLIKPSGVLQEILKILLMAVEKKRRSVRVEFRIGKRGHQGVCEFDLFALCWGSQEILLEGAQVLRA